MHENGAGIDKMPISCYLSMSLDEDESALTWPNRLHLASMEDCNSPGQVARRRADAHRIRMTTGSVAGLFGSTLWKRRKRMLP